MKLEEILPEIRKGRKARRKDWVDTAYIKVHAAAYLYLSEAIANDWELVPEPVKHKETVYLWEDGLLTTYGIRMSEKYAKLIETREIEWSVE